MTTDKVLSIVAISPTGKLFGNSIMYDDETLARHHLEKDARTYAEPAWPRIFIKSIGQIQVELG